MKPSQANSIDDYMDKCAADNDAFLDRLDAEGKAEEKEQKAADAYEAKHGGDWFTLSPMERRAWRAVYPGKLFECGMKIPEMPDTAEGRYWKMSSKDRKAWKLANPTPWLDGPTPISETPWLDGPTPVLKIPAPILPVAPIAYIPTVLKPPVRVGPIVRTPVVTNRQKTSWWQRLFFKRRS
jgi:hypothetical protein